MMCKILIPAGVVDYLFKFMISSFEGFFLSHFLLYQVHKSTPRSLFHSWGICHRWEWINKVFWQSHSCERMRDLQGLNWSKKNNSNKVIRLRVFLFHFLLRCGKENKVFKKWNLIFCFQNLSRTRLQWCFNLITLLAPEKVHKRNILYN